MAQLSSVENPTPSRHRLLFAGVAAATVMGVSLGLWARPAMSERQQTARPPAATPEPAPRALRLQIVVDDTPAPLGAPIEVLPATASPPMILPPPEHVAPELQAPVRPASGLVRVQTIEPQEAEPAPRAARKPVVRVIAKATEQPRPVVRSKPFVLVKAPAPKARPARVQKAKVVVVERAPLKVEKARVARAGAKPSKPARPKVQFARIERHVKPARIEKAAARAAPRRPERAPKVQNARVERKAIKAAPKPRVEKVAVKVKRAKAAPVRPLKPARGAGPLRVARAPRPDPTLRDADRQMSRAYSTARAAGVPDWKLQRQQQRWEQARASAAHEAPWAVHDVYLARIAELHDLTRDANGPGY